MPGCTSVTDQLAIAREREFSRDPLRRGKLPGNTVDLTKVDLAVRCPKSALFSPQSRGMLMVRDAQGVS
jgi:hypothetical protein